MWENTPLGKSRPVKPQGLFSSDRCSFVIKTFIQITEGPRAEISQRLHTTPREIIFLLGANERLNLGHLSAVNECIILDRNRYIYTLEMYIFSYRNQTPRDSEACHNQAV